MKLFFFYIIFALTVFSCKKDKDDFAFIGGEISNPNTNFVVISKADLVLDTISLDKNNRFIYKVDNLISGIYTFKHGGEVQMVLLEPNDSITFRLNTLDFDESLVFTGTGDKKNNYLINGFLQNEIEQKRIFKFCQLSPEKYQNQIDSLKAEKDLKLETFKKKYNPSDLFIKIAQANIDYNYYASKEIYPFIHYGENKRDIINALPNDFYDYRKEIDYNNDYNRDFLNYNSFLRSTFNNIALKTHLDHSKSDDFNTNTLCYNLDILNVVDSIISTPTIKNDLLFYYTMTYLTRNNNSEDNNVMLESFISKNTDEENKHNMSSVAHSINNLKTGNSFPNLELVDLKNNDINIASLINKPTVIYFWSHKFNNHFKESHYKTNELSIKYPEISFISINVDDNSPDFCKDSMKKNNFSYDNEFKFKDPKQSRLSLAVYPITKTIILDKNNIIVNPHSNIFSVNFEEQLLGLINR
ncbi:TlpA family protein disulfide reductase [Confluentibacter flavum]|uniref:Thioredoxin domain-containing protein n=1 Tax=Confluentibacter flavum TaxID=1909700 RepID=A0A2N3HGT5_9FLAO|nr:hypothetical protein [Confluentibacter flavum]PKQ44133.1 hypothetical protein CSW08_15180 [Confluentibacter flavum]